MNRIPWSAISLARVPRLVHLDLSNNKTPGIHPSVWGLTALTHLDLSHNSIDRIDAGISALTGLEVRRRRCCLYVCVEGAFGGGGLSCVLWRVTRSSQVALRPQRWHSRTPTPHRHPRRSCACATTR